MILAVVQARVSSTRLPGKVLKKIVGKPMLTLQIERINRASVFDRLVIATSDHESDNDIVGLCAEAGVECYRGSLDDVLDRFYQVAMVHNATHIVRLTGDCPLTDPRLIDEVVRLHLSGGFDYTSNTIEPRYPDGLDATVMRFESLEAAWNEATLKSEREHVAPFIWKQPERFNIGSYCGQRDYSHMRWTVDEPEDFEFVKRVYESLYPDKPDFATEDILRLIQQQPELKEINSMFTRNEGYQKSLQEDKLGVEHE